MASAGEPFVSNALTLIPAVLSPAVAPDTSCFVKSKFNCAGTMQSVLPLLAAGSALKAGPGGCHFVGCSSFERSCFAVATSIPLDALPVEVEAEDDAPLELLLLWSSLDPHPATAMAHMAKKMPTNLSLIGPPYFFSGLTTCRKDTIR